jgi:signal transduction histidine kinase
VKTENDELTSIYVNVTTKLKSNSYVDISDWKMEVLKRMFSVLILSFILIFSTILLFYILYKRMLKQNKISEVQTDFANNITHELKTPLASLALIIKSLEIKEIYNQPEKVQELTSTLKRQYLRLQNVVDNVLESSISNEEIPLNSCNIKDFLNHYLQNINFNNHQIKISISDKDIILETNTTRLENVLNNLIENAIKYSSENSGIEIVSSLNEKYYVIEIKDQGIGISKDNLDKIFDKFYRVSEKNIHTTKGLGLGLYLCKMVVSKLGGKLSVESTLGKGSTFLIELPIYKN